MLITSKNAIFQIIMSVTGRNMHKPIKQLVIVGGGAAGWITAGLIAAKYSTDPQNEHHIQITLVRSPDIPTIGVGEGTWPSMRQTLQTLGISEQDFLTSCDASFKQGSQFIGWQHGKQEHYYHPFTLPLGNNNLNLATYWLPFQQQVSFADAVCIQPQLCEHNKAPKLISTPEYQAIANYGYHLDATKFGLFLEKHCTEKLGVKLLVDHITGVEADEQNDITAVLGQKFGRITGDLFIDCTGTNSLLLDQHYHVPFISLKNVLFNDSALAIRLPYPDDQIEIASQTKSTALANGWIWDIALPTRQGVGYTFSSSHTTPEQAEQQFLQHLQQQYDKKYLSQFTIKPIRFEPGHRQVFWKNNCVAVGMAAGFIEPLEASALALIELSAKMLAEQLPANRAVMSVVAKRFNEKFSQRWQQITEFLKLHYAISQRDDSDYWRDHRLAESIPESLQQKLLLWQHQPPFHYDSEYTEELFPWASYQYVLYGMGFKTHYPLAKLRQANLAQAKKLFDDNQQHIKKLLSILPTNRALLTKIRQYGLSKI